MVTDLFPKASWKIVWAFWKMISGNKFYRNVIRIMMERFDVKNYYLDIYIYRYQKKNLVDYYFKDRMKIDFRLKMISNNFLN
jgi:hypothetical protein